MIYELKTKLKTKKGCELFAPAVIEWCAVNMKSGKKRYWPNVVIELWDSTFYDDGEVGYFDSDDVEIHLAYNKIRNVEELIRTIIHEWTHYIQSRDVLLLDPAQEYRDQLCEVEAFKNEDTLYEKCWTDIKILFNY